MSFATPFDRYVAPARARPQLWRFLAGIVVILVMWTTVTVGVFLGLGRLLPGFGSPQAVMDWLMTTPAGVLAMLASFAGPVLGVWAAARWLHGRGFATLLGRGAQVVRDFLVTAGIVLGLALPLTALSLPLSDIAPGLAVSRWLLLLPLTLVGIGVQTLSEELLFRGYILQQMAARFRSRIAWMILPSLVFSALHIPNESSVGTLFGTLPILFLFGLAAADLTALTGSIGAAWGFHFANNFVGIALVSSGEMLNGLALGRAGLGDAGGPAPGPSPRELALNAAMVVLPWYLCRRALRR